TNTLGADTTSLFVSVDFPDPATPTSSATACEGTTAVLTATAPSTVFWYLNGIKVAEGDTYEVGPLEAGMVLEVTNAVPEDPITGGPTDNNFGTGGYHNTGFTGTVLFEAHQGFVLESVFVDADGDGNRLIELFDQAGNVVNSVTVFMPNGQSQVELNLEVPGPGNYAVGGSSIALYRNDAGAMYPYEIGNVATITGSPAGGEFYYYLYNWVVRPAPCESLKVPVDLTILDAPDATFEYVQAGATFEFTDLTSDAVSWLWDFGDGNTSTEENPVHTYAQDGTYTVTLTVENAECSASITEEVVIELVGTSTVEGLEEFELFPVPGAGTPQLNLVLEQQADIQVQVINNLGQIVWQDQAKATDRYSRRLDLTAQASGTYFIAVQIGDEKVYKRYVLMR
ncbi:MAG: PKD domain-containing protein, partial [Phaeodactylibacter sp.]|nr:PKD domain-containing protein [Phaeodactylibacter sp.]